MTHTQTQGADGAGTKTAGQTMVLLPMDDPRRPLNDSGLPSVMIWAGGEAYDDLTADKAIDLDSCSLAVGIYRAMTEAHAKEIATLSPAPAATPGVPDSLREAFAAATDSPVFVHDFADPAVSSAPGCQDVSLSFVTPDHITAAFMGNGLAGTIDQARKDAVALAAAWNHVRALIAAQPAGQSTDDGTDRCEVCNKPLIAGQRVMQDVELGTVHTACCGPEREAYVKDVETGEPLGPNDPIPQGYVYEPGPSRPVVVCNGDPAGQSAGQGAEAEPWKTLRKIAELRFAEDACEPFDEALDLADAALANKPAPDSTRTGAAETSAEDDITQPMIQAGRYAANLNDSTLARIYLAMRTVEWEEAQASARDQPPASSGKVQLVEMDEIWTFKETRKYLLSEIERLRDDLHAVGKNLTGEQPEAVSCLDTAYGRTANISSILSNAPTATQIPASSDPAALAEQEEGDA
ncbi:hypothetical protein [Methylorubrum extorquens]|uniref:Uncharacterized protein n=1 Tax=Methylorubrum extorquens DSM 13060 TaxID=882800 RepID=H1KCB8_METEX|nr:hypothetical protein [Methylorubrum extorquens]EHP94935.1 hypothetical protein MetexDRAFT_0280 [Methylorubrum extorquens DSM 13060]